MNKLIIYIIIGVVVLFFLFFIFDQISDHLKFKRNQKWQEHHTEKMAKKKEKEKQKKLEKLSWVYIGNPIVESILSDPNIRVSGNKGSGKDLSCAMFANYLCQKYSLDDLRNKGFNKYLRPKYLQSLNRLKKNKELRVATMNVDYEDNNGFKSGNLWDYITQKKKIVHNSIFVWSEIGNDAGKDLYYNYDAKNSNDVKMIDDFFRFGRKYGAKIIVNEQSADNIYKLWRNTGFNDIQAIKTLKPISSWGKTLRKILTYFNAVAPAYFTLNWKKTFEKQVFLKNKILTFFKMFLPTRICLPREYYLTKLKIFNYIQNKYQWFKIRYNYYGQDILLQFKHNQFFKYDTNWGKQNYDKRFDNKGESYGQ